MKRKELMGNWVKLRFYDVIIRRGKVVPVKCRARCLATHQIVVEHKGNSIGFDASKKVAAQGGNVAKVAMKELEAKTGKKVVTALNAKTVLAENKTVKKLNPKKPKK